MSDFQNYILTLNGGSSSIRFAFYSAHEDLKLAFAGKLGGIGNKISGAILTTSISDQTENIKITENTYEHATHFLINWLENRAEFSAVAAIGHRIVHGMKYSEPQEITPDLLDYLKKISPYDPEHLPEEIRLIELFSKRHPDLKQIVCFDTSFHAEMPAVAKRLPIPRRFTEKNIQRYGFHGLSYAYLMLELERQADKKVAHGKVILAHLGNGASLAAVKQGKSMDTTMGFTPGSGVMMGTRSGDLDPGVAWYLMQFEKLSPKQFNHVVNHESGLLGISETSSDMQELMKSEVDDNRAAEAIELFCYQIKKSIGSFAAVLGGVNTLVFSGGIGENIPQIRSRICQDLGFLGIELDEKRNQINDPVISMKNGKVTIRVIATNEEIMIARLVRQVLNYNIKQ
ncbi:acetate/propionate family kinase [Dyadobacter psychrotolerans]|uniref:Acetate kinase n=1 Tax=Dyadobacter psychrotolerans TaxID=2541721 RepID=A0A4R5DSH9_9BACT|nr:acetate/propionate family kinase [Dyadobacter psychrotolerans]TDE17309.1 acetate/propionate family kinase [Dyadobacter psychrotolerans]